MLARVNSGTTIGLDGVLIEVEVDVASSGFPTFTIVGLPNKAIDESKDRVRTALVNSDFEMPDSRLTVNLAPADIPKEGSSFDLPIAVGILAASGLIKKDLLKNSLFVGELSLEGKVRHITGVISMAFMTKKKHIENIFVPASNAFEAGLVDGIDVFPIYSLSDLVLHLNGLKTIEKQLKTDIQKLGTTALYEFDFADIKGQSASRRALEIAAAGAHNIHLTGPPGAGKTMLCRAFPSILPSMDKTEIIDVSKIYSVAGLLGDLQYMNTRPFRSPHHTTSRIGLIGGGSNPRPGEITLAHRGVLFLDEFPEFPRSVLESLRQPLEDGVISISRASGSLVFPCRFLLLAASNPCPCGYLGHPRRACHCMPGTILKYKKRLSGPLLDRIDIHIFVPAVDEDKLIQSQESEPSESVRKRVTYAQNIQKKRFAGTRIRTNSEMGPREIKKYCKISQDATNLLKTAISKLSLSARSYFKMIKLAQTICDLGGKHDGVIDQTAVAEALQYRAKEE